MMAIERNAPDIEKALQWALDDLLNKKKLPDQETLSAIPPGEASEIIEAISKGLQENNEVGAQRVFLTLCKNIDTNSRTSEKTGNWLKKLRARPIPPRPGTEEEGQAQTENEELPYGTAIGKSG